MARRHRRHHLPDPPRAFSNFLIRSSLLFDGVGGSRCQAGWPLHCSRSCCARRLRTSRCRRICASWRWHRSHRPPIRTRPPPLLASTSLGLPPTSPGLVPTSPSLGSSIPTPSWIRRKCRPRQPLYCPPKGQSTNCRRKGRRRTAHQIEPSENPARSLTAAHHSRSVGYLRRRSRRSDAVAVTEPFQPSSCLALRLDFTGAERRALLLVERIKSDRYPFKTDPLNCSATHPPGRRPLIPSNTSGTRSGAGCAQRRTPLPISIPCMPRSGPC
jgi:hypothetical protein